MAVGRCKVLAPFGGRREEPDVVSPPRQPPEAIPTSVFRTLRFQLIAIAVLTVATVLVLSQWVDTRLSERAQERDLQERAHLALRTVASMWGRTEHDALRQVLVAGRQRAESGELGIRVEAARGGEFAFVAGTFNRMLSRIEELTAGLESRVRQATRDLAEKNRELQQANERLWQSQLEVGRSGRLAAPGQMAATIAHELGTPLNSVLGYTPLLQRESWPADDREKLAIIDSPVQPL